MTRPQVIARTATPDDVPALADLWEELRHVGGRAERAVNPSTAADVKERLASAICAPDCRVVMACIDGRPVGMAVLSVIRPDPLSDNLLVQISHLVVARADRHHGVGHSLVAAAADFAGEHQLDHVGVSAYPSLREAHRFYARLGFAPVAVRRVAPLAVLRRRVSADRSAATFGDVVRRRTRIGRPVPPQRNRPTGITEPVDS